MTGQDEDRVTYPTFFKVRGLLYFLYRNGKAGKGSAHLNVYNHNTKKWKPVHHPFLVSRKAWRSPYWDNVVVDKRNNRVHISWVYRDYGHNNKFPPSGNNTLCYAYANNLGLDKAPVWHKADGTIIPNPQKQDPSQPVIRRRDCDIVDSVNINQGLTNQNSLTIDGAGRPHIAYRKYGTQKNNNKLQIFHAYPNPHTWQTVEVTHSSFPPASPIILYNNDLGYIITKFSYSGYIIFISQSNFVQRDRHDFLSTNASHILKPPLDYSLWFKQHILSLIYPKRNNFQQILLSTFNL